jgi:ribosome-binding factor A
MTARTDRVDELLRQEIGDILSREVADPRIGFVTVTDVETTPDFRHARVWVSIIGQPEEREATLRALGRAMPFVRHALGERVRLRRIPELHLREDDTAQRGTRVLQLLTELEEGRDPDVVPQPGESLPTPVARLPHEGDAAADPSAVHDEAPPSKSRPRRRGSAGRASGPGGHGSTKRRSRGGAR